MKEKINKYIEIVTIPGDTRQSNIAITLDVGVILDILRKTFSKVFISIIKTEDDLKNLVSKKPDLVFSGVKYFSFNGGTNIKPKTIWLNDYLDEYNIPYIGSNRKALEKEYNKSRAKRIVQKLNINTAHFFIAKPGKLLTAESITTPFPLFVKPISGGDSRGIDQNSIVHNFKDLQEKVLSIYQNQHLESLVETYLPGREYSVAILEDCLSNNIDAMPIEIIANKNRNGDRILDLNAKKNDKEKLIRVTDLVVHKQISDLAKKAFRALGGKSFGRIDIKMDEHQIPYFIEANLMPGLGSGYFYRTCLLNQNINYEQMILRIASNGLSYQKNL